MTKEQFLRIIEQKGRGKYIAILDEFVDEKRATYGTRELYNLLIYEFDLKEEEIEKFSYFGFNGALKKYKKQLTRVKRQGSSPEPAEGGDNVSQDDNGKQAWAFKDADDLDATRRLDKYKNL